MSLSKRAYPYRKSDSDIMMMQTSRSGVDVMAPTD